MKTLALADGDLVMTPHGHLTVDGETKVRLELHLNLGEEVGTDRFHPKFGSYLLSYIGTPLTAEAEMAVQAEVIRVVNNYILTQRDEILEDNLNANRSRFATADVVQQLISVDVQTSLDRIYLRVVLATQAQGTISITKSVSL